jgi:pyridoxine/pyridoxamine 5'-phosphate oxidase
MLGPMRETAEDLERLQALLDASEAKATPFLRSSLEMPKFSLDAAALAARLDGVITVALATVTKAGEPRVAPIDSVFLRGAFYIPTVAQSVRARNLARSPAASLTYYEGITMAAIVHGTATALGPDEDPFDELEEIRMAADLQPIREWGGDPIFLRINPDLLYTYAKEL